MVCFSELTVKYLFSDGLGEFGKIHLPRHDLCFKTRPPPNLTRFPRLKELIGVNIEIKVM